MRAPESYVSQLGGRLIPWSGLPGGRPLDHLPNAYLPSVGWSTGGGRPTSFLPYTIDRAVDGSILVSSCCECQSIELSTDPSSSSAFVHIGRYRPSLLYPKIYFCQWFKKLYLLILRSSSHSSLPRWRFLKYESNTNESPCQFNKWAAPLQLPMYPLLKGSSHT